jgi:ribonuclease J
MAGARRARIHRGAQEVGGNCLELEDGGLHLLLDLGRPLTAPAEADMPLPDVAGLREHDPSLVGVVLTHPHVDHFGLMAGVSSEVPIFIGEAAHRILREAAFFTRSGLACQPAGFLRHRQSFALGPFTVTPYLMDHSAFDSYSILVEAGGRRLFYTGDLRAHGRKARLFEELVRNPPGGVDALVMEGTNIRPDVDIAKRGRSEVDVENECVETFRAARGMVLAIYSPQNIDRLVSIYRAAIGSGRDLVLDLYGAAIAAATGRETIPQAHWERVRVYLPNRQRAKVIESGEFHRTDAVRADRIYPEELVQRRGELVLTFRQSMSRELEKAGCLPDAHAVWSMWPGYLEEPSGQKLRAFLERHGLGMTVHHASGHAFIPDLQRLVAALAPRCVVPIHTFGSDRFCEFFPRTERHADGEWWEV